MNVNPSKVFDTGSGEYFRVHGSKISYWDRNKSKSILNFIGDRMINEKLSKWIIIAEKPEEFKVINRKRAMNLGM